MTSSAATIAFPFYSSCSAIHSMNPIHLKVWLIYWMILPDILVAESWVMFILNWYKFSRFLDVEKTDGNRLPFYSWIRLTFMMYLVLPQTQGAQVFFMRYVSPFLNKRVEHSRIKQLGLQCLYYYLVNSSLENMGISMKIGPVSNDH